MSVQTQDAPVTMRGAIFEAFRKREREGVLLAAGMGLLTALVAIIGGYLVILQGPLADFVAWYIDLLSTIATNAGGPPPSFKPPPDGLFVLIPSYFLLIFLVCVAMASFEAACLRWMLRGESDGLFFGLNLAADTWRVYIGYWIWFSCTIGSFYAAEIAAFIVGLAAAGIVAAAGYPTESIAVGFIAGGAVALVAGSALIWAAVRMAPAAATSIEKRRFAFFEAWKMSRGQVGPMLGSFVLAWLAYYGVLIAVELAIFAVAFGSLSEFFSLSASMPDPKAFFARLMQPPTLAVLVTLGLILAAAAFLFHLALFGINARAVMVARARA